MPRIYISSQTNVVHNEGIVVMTFKIFWVHGMTQCYILGHAYGHAKKVDASLDGFLFGGIVKVDLLIIKTN